jgi:hypothetical protein
VTDGRWRARWRAPRSAESRRKADREPSNVTGNVTGRPRIPAETACRIPRPSRNHAQCGCPKCPSKMQSELDSIQVLARSASLPPSDWLSGPPSEPIASVVARLFSTDLPAIRPEWTIERCLFASSPSGIAIARWLPNCQAGGESQVSAEMLTADTIWKYSHRTGEWLASPGDRAMVRQLVPGLINGLCRFCSAGPWWNDSDCRDGANEYDIEIGHRESLGAWGRGGLGQQGSTRIRFGRDGLQLGSIGIAEDGALRRARLVLSVFRRGELVLPTTEVAVNYSAERDSTVPTNVVINVVEQLEFQAHSLGIGSLPDAWLSAPRQAIVRLVAHPSPVLAVLGDRIRF